jgi:hypothetical protein
MLPITSDPAAFTVMLVVPAPDLGPFLPSNGFATVNAVTPVPAVKSKLLEDAASTHQDPFDTVSELTRVVTLVATNVSILVFVSESPVKLITCEAKKLADALSVIAIVCDPEVAGLRKRNRYRIGPDP